MSHRSRRRSRSRSRDSRQRSYGRSSYGSYSRSRSNSKPRRYTSRDRRSISRSRGTNTNSKYNGHYNDRQWPAGQWNPVHHRPPTWNMFPNMSMKTDSSNVPMFPPPYRPQMFGRYPPRKHPNLRYGHNTYESPDYRSQRNHSGRSNQKSQQGPTTDVSKGQLAELTSQLNNLVAQLANLPKDAPERDEVNREITIVKAKMKKVKTEPASSAGNMNRKLLFNDLPESAKGPGNLAAWIAGKAAILQPKQIAMLATTAAGAVIEYKSLSVAEEVLRSCKKHQIAACWAPSEITHEVSKEGDHVDTEMHTDVDYNLL